MIAGQKRIPQRKLQQIVNLIEIHKAVDFTPVFIR